MIHVKLPDGTVQEYPDGTRPRDIAEKIGSRLAKAAVAAVIDDQIVDLDRPIEANGPVAVRILTSRDPEALAVLRHSAAHVMARAVMRLFPGVQLAFGPAIENGYYYDIDSPTPIREEDFPRIEAEMAKIVKEAEPFERFSLSTPEARSFVQGLNQGYKVEHIDDDLKQYPTLSFYRQGEFADLCRGPHIPDAGRIGAFKLLSIAGAYWKNDSSRKQLQRLYGTAFFDKKDLDAYLRQVEEAKKRDHRKLGKELGLFTISPLVGPGLILWMPRGAIVRTILEGFMREELRKRGYLPVYTPNIGKIELYQTSGHYPYYRDSQFPPLRLLSTPANELVAGLERDDLSDEDQRHLLTAAGIPPEDYFERDRTGRIAFVTERGVEEEYLLKPMNCPHHIQIYAAQPHSYRDLPVRLAEFGTVYRFEQSGELSGMTRVRGFTQDDAHIFCTPDQVEDELRAMIDLTRFVLDSLGFEPESYRVRIGLRDPAGDKYTGSDENWNRAEESLRRVVSETMPGRFTEEPGEAAFYGPKIDFVVRDCIGREWQLGTVQLDYNLPERFGLEYMGSDNQPHRPVMIHRAPFGSMERFIGILIEHFAGAFPLWLAPEQVRVLSISEKSADYAARVVEWLRAEGLRAEADRRAEKIGAKIRDAQLAKVPYMLVVGEKEQASETVAVRERGAGDLGAMPLDRLIAMLQDDVRDHTIRPQRNRPVDGQS